MQTYIAAASVSSRHQHGIAIDKPDEGKTYTMLHFARHMINEDKSGKT